MNRVQRGAGHVCGALFAAVFLVFLYKIALRYLEHDSPAWADEICVILFIWMVFLANGFMLGDREQVAFDLAYRPMPPVGRRVMAVGRALLIGGVFAWALPTVIDYILFLRLERTPVLGWRLDAVYACFAVFAACVVARAGWALLGLLRPGWRAHL